MCKANKDTPQKTCTSPVPEVGSTKCTVIYHFSSTSKYAQLCCKHKPQQNRPNFVVITFQRVRILSWTSNCPLGTPTSGSKPGRKGSIKWAMPELSLYLCLYVFGGTESLLSRGLLPRPTLVAAHPGGQGHGRGAQDQMLLCNASPQFITVPQLGLQRRGALLWSGHGSDSWGSPVDEVFPLWPLLIFE